MTMYGENVNVEVKDGKAVITIDLTKTFGRSASGKSITVASTKGNVVLDGTGGVTLGLNAYKK